MLDEETLEATAVVANNRMNRERQLRRTNGYDRDLGFDVVELLRGAGASAAWLDACCGSGRALFEAELSLPTADLVGVDLVEMLLWEPTDPGSRASWKGRFPAWNVRATPARRSGA